MSKKVIKPGKWWIIQLRAIKTYDQIACKLICKNGYHAGHRSSEHKTRWCWWKGKRVRSKIPRRWALKHPKHGVPYRFDDLSEARKNARLDIIKKWVTRYGGFVEIVEREGCLYYGTVISETVIERKFRKGTNEMVVLTLSAL